MSRSYLTRSSRSAHRDPVRTTIRSASNGATGASQIHETSRPSAGASLRPSRTASGARLGPSWTISARLTVFLIMLMTTRLPWISIHSRRPNDPGYPSISRTLSSTVRPTVVIAATAAATL